MGQVWTEEDIKSECEYGLKVVVRWARTENPDFSHYGRFILRPSDARAEEMVLKNPRCWRGATLIRTDRVPYFATSRENIMSQVDEICPADEGDTGREEAMAFVEATWKPLIERISGGDYLAIDIEVRVYHADTGILLISDGAPDVEVDAEGSMWDTAMTFVGDGGFIDAAKSAARVQLRKLLPTAIFHGLTTEQNDALLMAIDFHSVNAEDDDDKSFTQHHLDSLKSMVMGGVL